MGTMLGSQYTAPTTISSQQNITIMATSAADGVTAGTAIATLTPAATVPQSLMINSTLRATIPSANPYTSVGSFTVAGRYSNWTAQPSDKNLMNLAGQSVGTGYAFLILTTSMFQVVNFAEGSTVLQLSISGISDFIFLFSRTVSTGAMQLEIWNTQTGVCSSTTGAASSPRDTINFGGNLISHGDASARVAFWRWNSGLKAGAPCATSRQPHEYDSPSNLLDYEFEGNLSDSSGHVASGSANSPVYTPTPTYAPSCNADRNPIYGRTFRAGQAAILDGSASAPLDGGNTLTYSWSQLGSYQSGAAWSSTSVVNPSVTGLVQNPFNVQLTVTQRDGQQTTCNVHHGVVSVDTLDRITGITDLGSSIVPGKTNAEIIFGPMKMNGTNPWLFIDEIALPWAKHFGEVQGTTAGGMSFEKPWETAATGNIDVVNASTAIVGHGTSFGTLLCGGTAPCSPTGKYLVVWYKVPAPLPSLVGRAYIGISGVTDDTHLTVSSTWGLTANQAGLSFNVETESQIGSWINGSGSNNYYDAVMALYAIYFQTRRDYVLDWAHWLADAWWAAPGVDRYRGCDGGGGGGAVCLAPRVRGFTGMVIRTLELDRVSGIGSSDRWPFLYHLVDTADDTDLNRTSYPIGGISDLREEGKQIDEEAMLALFAPTTGTYGNAGRQTIYLTSLANAISNRWAPQQQADGSWQGAVCNQKCNYGSPDVGGTLSVTNGHATVTLVGGTWSATNFCNASTTGQLFSFGNSLDYATWDSQVYTATRTSSTTATISPVYNGTTATGRFLSLSCGGGTGDWTGFITQPFMLNFVANAFRLSHYALQYGGGNAPFNSTAAAQAKTFVGQIANWIATNDQGLEPSPSRAMKYGSGASCRWPSPPASCVGDRLLPMETTGACSGAYIFNPSAALKAKCDLLYAAFAAKYSSDIGYDGTYAADYDPFTNPVGYFFSTYNAKWIAFEFGYGRVVSWPAARLSAGAI